jgi:hypothetical protein
MRLGDDFGSPVAGSRQENLPCCNKMPSLVDHNQFWKLSKIIIVTVQYCVIYTSRMQNTYPHSVDPREIGYTQIIPALSSHLRPRLPRGVRREDVCAVTHDAICFVIAQTQHCHIRLASSALSYGRYDSL